MQPNYKDIDINEHADTNHIENGNSWLTDEQIKIKDSFS